MRIEIQSLAIALLSTLSASCSEGQDPPSPASTQEEEPQMTMRRDAGGANTEAIEEVPVNVAELRKYLAARAYLGFAAETEAHTSSGPHMGRVRTHVNEKLRSSLAAGNAEHPQGAAAVKELFGADGSRVPLGWAVMVKLAAGDEGDSWFWYEWFDGALHADAPGAKLCVDCHRSGADFFVSSFPLD